MNEEFNPYAQQPAPQDEAPAAPVQPQYYDYPQQSVRQQQYDIPQQPIQQQYQPPVQPQYNYQPPVQPQYQQPVYYYPAQRAPRQPGAGAAKAFSIVSFVAGCISLFIVLLWVLMIGVLGATHAAYSTYASSSGSEALFSLTASYSVILGIPGMIFGIVAMVKKTKLMPMAVMGVVFNGLLILAAAFSLLAMV